MTRVLITYDLNSPGQKYDALLTKIKSLGWGWAHIMQSTWIVSGYGLTADGVRDTIRTVLDDNDTVFTVSLDDGSYSGWLEAKFWTWLKEAA